MIGVFIIAHGTFGEALLHNVIHILNQRPEQIINLGLAAQDDPMELLPLARSLLASVDTGDGVVLLTDIYGASPSNLACKMLQRGRIEGLSGLNLPMLLRVLNYRDKGMETMMERAISGACESVMRINNDNK